jgi:hypothetical protein
MTSDSDDLEQALRENLKLRRKLGAEAAKGKTALSAKQAGGVSYRLGWVLYWASLACIGLWWVACIVGISAQGMPMEGGKISWAFLFFILGGVPVLLYGLGRLLRYVLSGE